MWSALISTKRPGTHMYNAHNVPMFVYGWTIGRQFNRTFLFVTLFLSVGGQVKTIWISTYISYYAKKEKKIRLRLTYTFICGVFEFKHVFLFQIIEYFDCRLPTRWLLTICFLRGQNDFSFWILHQIKYPLKEPQVRSYFEFWRVRSQKLT